MKTADEMLKVCEELLKKCKELDEMFKSHNPFI